MNTILSQVFGILGMLTIFVMFQQKDRLKLLKLKMCADVLWGIHYAFLLAWGGLVPNVVGVMREFVFMNNEKKWARSRLWLILFIIISWVMAIFVWKDLFNIIPIIGSTIAILAFWSKNIILTKTLSILVAACFLSYNIYVGSLVGVINEVIGILSIIIYFVKTKPKKEQNTQDTHI